MSSDVGGVKGGGYRHSEKSSRAKRLPKSAKKTEEAASKKRGREPTTQAHAKSKYDVLPKQKPGPIKKPAAEVRAKKVNNRAEQILTQTPTPPPPSDSWLFSYIKKPEKSDVVNLATDAAGAVYSYALNKIFDVHPILAVPIGYTAKKITSIALKKMFL